MRWLENFMNRLADLDWSWWPMLCLRPPQDKDIDNRVLLKMTPIFGTAVSFFIFAARMSWTRAVRIRDLVIELLAGWVLFFITCKFTLGHFWNCRARRLRQGRAGGDGKASS